MSAFNCRIDTFLKDFDERSFSQATKLCDYFYNSSMKIIAYGDVSGDEFVSYLTELSRKGFEVKETRVIKNNIYKGLEKDNLSVFINYFGNIKEIHIAIEENSKYFDFSDNSNYDISLVPQITQLDQEDFGMSYTIRLSDGRYIVIDGGEEFVKSAEGIMNTIKAGSPFKKPIIAAWFITHLHNDHHNCFNTFMKMFGDDVTVEKMLFAFPDADDVEQFPNLAHLDLRFSHGGYVETVSELMGYIKKYRVPIYQTHTGQIYKIGDAVCEILSSQDDDTKRLAASDLNNTSQVIRMTIANQVILWCGDAYFENVKLGDRYEDYLKCDILQVPHHGFPGGTIKGYEYIDPSVCLLPVSYYNAFVVIDTFNKNTNYLMTKMNVKELITGTENRTINLPYTARRSGVEELKNNYRDGRDANGAKSWCFSELFTDNDDDCCFTITNTCHIPVKVYIDLYFENAVKRVLYIKAEVEPFTLKKINLKTKEGIDAEALSFNSFSLNKKGLPDNEQFTARFTCDYPVFVSNKGKAIPYHSSVNR